jgi:hypothetical protein
MSTSAPRRERVERGIYRRPSGVLEVGYKDETGRLRWRTINGAVLAARKVRDDLNARRARGESIVPKAKLRFGEASQAWLVGPVLDLRDTTQAKYRCMIREHLDPRFALTTLDTISADDMASLVRELRSEGKSEATIVVILSVVAHVYKYALRRLGWSGMTPTTLMLRSERPKVSRTKRRPIFTGEQLEQTIAAATEPLPHAVCRGGPHRRAGLRAVWAHLSGHPHRGSGGRRDRVRVPGRPSRHPPTHQDRRLSSNCPHHPRAGAGAQPPPRPGTLPGPGRPCVRDRHWSSSAAAQRCACPTVGAAPGRRRRRTANVSDPASARHRRRARGSPTRHAAVDALLPTYGRVTGAPCRRERRRGGVHARTPRWDYHPCGLRT